MKRVETVVTDEEHQLLSKLAADQLKSVKLYLNELIKKHLKKVKPNEAN